MLTGPTVSREQRGNREGNEVKDVTASVPGRLLTRARAVFSISSPLRARLARGALWSVIDSGFTRGSALVISIVVARTVGREHFGQFGIVQNTIGLFGLFAGLGMSLTATKYVAELRHSEPSRTGRILGLSTLLAVVSSIVICAILVATAPWLARTTLASTEVGSLLRVGCGLLFFYVLNGAVCGALYGFEAFKSIAIVDVVAAIVGFGVVIVAVLIDGVRGAILGLVVGDAIQFLGYSFFLRRELHSHGLSIVYKGCFTEWPVLARFSLPALLAGAMTGPANWICSAILVNQPAGYAQMGLFNAANQWRAAIMLLPLTLSTPLLPVLSSLFHKEPGKYSKVLFAGVAVNASLALIGAAGVILFSHAIMASYGTGFAGGRSVLICLVLSAVMTASVWSVGQAITSSGRMWWGLGINFVWAVALITSLWILRRQGAYGYALATLLAYGVHLLTSVYAYSRVCTVKGGRNEPLPVSGWEG